MLHLGDLDSRGRPVLEHVLRVAIGVHCSGRPLALVHEVCVRSDYSPRHVALEVGLDRESQRALQLVTPELGETLSEHVDRVLASPPGGSFELAVAVLRADLADHRRHSSPATDVYVRALRRMDRGVSVW